MSTVGDLRVSDIGKQITVTTKGNVVTGLLWRVRVEAEHGHDARFGELGPGRLYLGPTTISLGVGDFEMDVPRDAEAKVHG